MDCVKFRTVSNKRRLLNNKHMQNSVCTASKALMIMAFVGNNSLNGLPPGTLTLGLGNPEGHIVCQQISCPDLALEKRIFAISKK